MSPEQRSGGCRWTLTGHETPTGTPYNAIDGPRLCEFETVEVMPVAEMQERAAEIVRESIGSEVVRQCEDECSYLREALEDAIRSIETVGQINCHGRAYHELKTALDQSRSK